MPLAADFPQVHDITFNISVCKVSILHLKRGCNFYSHVDNFLASNLTVLCISAEAFMNSSTIMAIIVPMYCGAPSFSTHLKTPGVNSTSYQQLIVL